MTPAWPTWLRHDRRPVTVVRIASFLLADVAAFLLALLISSAAIDFFPPQPGPSATVVEATVLLMAGVVACLASIGHYRRRLPLWMTLRNLVGVSGAALLGSCLIELLTGRHDSLALLLGPWILLPPLALFARSLVRQSLDAAGLWKVPVIVVGTGRVAQQAVAALRSEARLGYEAVAVITPSSAALSTGAARWAPMLGQHGAEMLVLALDPEGGPRGTEIQSLVRERIPFAVIPSLDGLPLFGCEPTAFIQHDTVLLSYTNNLAKPVARAAKLGFDWLAAAALIVAMAPVLLAIAAAVKLDGGPVLFAHPRIGAGGRIFKCLKFRSMVTNSDAVLRDLLRTDPAAAAEWATTTKLKRDPRVTWIGRILRKSSLDELPQLFNVLRLEMSLVGPRPIVQAEVEKYAEDIAYYYETRPGLTGLWQVSGRSDTSYAERVRLDSWYVKNWTVWQDLAILARTIPAVIKQRGAV